MCFRGRDFMIITMMILTIAIKENSALAAESTWNDIMPKGAKVEKIAGDLKFIEGPVWMRPGMLVFSDIPADTLYSWKPGGKLEEFRKPSHNANGNTLDREGRLISCEHGSRQVTRTELNGKITILADRFEGKRLNSPNDVVVRSNGDIYFTDPPYGITKEQEELGFYGVYRISKAGKLTLVLNDFKRPNGLAFSPDEKLLYVDDTEGHHIRVFTVKSNGDMTNGHLFAEIRGDKPGVPDGMRVDTHGNVYCTGSGGIHVFAPSGRHLGVIEVPEVAANCAWGDMDGKSLYITASTGLYRIRLKIAGISTIRKAK